MIYIIYRYINYNIKVFTEKEETKKPDHIFIALDLKI